MEQPKPQAILNEWRQVGERLYGHPIGHPIYSEDTTLGIRPINPLEQPEPGVVVETKVAEWRLGTASRIGPRAVRHLLDVPYL